MTLIHMTRIASLCLRYRVVSFCFFCLRSFAVRFRHSSSSQSDSGGLFMDRRAFLKIGPVAGIGAGLSVAALGAEQKKSAAGAAGAKTASGAGSPNSILLKDYRPRSIYKVPVTTVDRAKFPIIDMHSHPYAKTAAEIEQWVRTMDEVGVEKTMILTMATGAEFDEIFRKYSKFPERFELWCGLA